MKHHNVPRANLKHFLAGGSMLATLALLIDLQGRVVNPKSLDKACQEVMQPSAVLSRDQLTKLLAIPERDKKSKVRAIFKEPYCKLPDIEVRAGVTAEREAYPLEFDPKTWIVILYEGDEYVGYRFSFR